MPLKLSDLGRDDKVEVTGGNEAPLKLSSLSPSDRIEYIPESSKVLSAMAGFSQGATLGFADEAVAGIKGAADYIEGKLGMRGDISLSNAYVTQRNAIRNANKKLQSDNPATFKTAEIAGAIAPVLGGAAAAAPATVGKVALGGAVAGQGYSEGDLGTTQNVLDTAIGAGASAATFGAFKFGGKIAGELAEKAKPVLEKAKPKLTQFLKDFAEERAAKAAIGGGNLKAFKDLAAKKDGIRKFGRAILDEDVTEQVFKDGELVKETTKPLMGLGSTPEKISEMAGKRLEEVGKIFDEVYDAIDDSFDDMFAKNQEKNLGRLMSSENLDEISKIWEKPPAPKPVDTVSIAQKLIDYADKNLNLPNYRTQIAEVYKQADEIAGMGSVSMRKAQSLRNSYSYKNTQNSGAEILPQDVKNKIKMIIGDEMDETVKKFDAMTPNSTGLYPIFKKAKDLYGNMKTAKDSGDKAAIREISNRFASPTDHLLGAATMASEAAASGGMSLPIAAKGMIVGALNKQVRGRGNSISAIAADNLADLITKNPKALGPYGPMLIGAARKGQNSIGALHQVLWRNDPKYRSLLSVEGEGNSSSLSAKPSLNDAMRRRSNERK